MTEYKQPTREQLEQSIHDNAKSLLNPAMNGNMTEPERLALGTLVESYLVASIFDMSWEGFDDTDLIGIKALVHDLLLAKIAGG